MSEARAYKVDIGRCGRSTASRRFRPSCSIAGACFAMALSLAALTSTAAAGECGNEAVRMQQHVEALPECRAYELVSPQGSAPPANYNQRPYASSAGDTFGYFSWNPYPREESAGLFLVNSRTASGWATRVATPPQGGLREAEEFFACNPSVYYNEEMTAILLADGLEEGEVVCDGDEPALVEGEPRGVTNLFYGGVDGSNYQLIDGTPLAGGARNAYLTDATPNLDHIVFSEAAVLTPGALGAGATNLYERSSGGLRLVSLAPGGAPVKGELANGPANRIGTANLTHAMSGDGESVFYYDTEQEALYLRSHALQEQSAIVSGRCAEPTKACTVQVDAAEEGAAGPGGDGVFLDASEDGTRAFFTDERRLTKDATAEAGNPDLYEYDAETGAVTDLTVDAGKAADVVGYAGASDDGSYLYFVAKGALGGAAVANEPNLYLLHNGATTFVATLAEPSDAADWRPIPARGVLTYQQQVTNNLVGSAHVTASGKFLAFGAAERLTGYDNQPAAPTDCPAGGPCQEIFLYGAGAHTIECVSCAASNVRPRAPATLQAPTAALLSGGPVVEPRNLLEDGRVFFDSRTVLSDGATEGVENVYEYDAGHVSLISTATGDDDSEFLEASPTGSDVFFETADGLVKTDTDNADSVYDARVDGGFLEEIGPASEPCHAVETCRAPLTSVPLEAKGGSQAVTGPGNLPHEAVPGGSGRRHHKKRRPQLRRRQRLQRALQRCGREPKAKRRACRARARRRFGGKTTRRSGRTGRRQK